MKTRTQSQLQALLLGGAAAAALMTAGGARAQDDRRLAFDIPQQEGAQALNQFAAQAGVQIVFPYATVRGRQAPAVQGDYTRDEALRQLTAALGLEVGAEKEGVISLRDPLAQGQGGSSAGADVDALIVTAQKREENIQDVPIAISAFSQEDLTRSQVAGGPDLMTQVPNMTFTKTNFTGYSIQIRGIGTQAISATTDAAVAVALNNTPFIRNRFFEQEFYDLQRVEVLRGPQGTLYGRNATAGVVNIISAKPKFGFESKLSADVSNYQSTRLEGMVNVPLVEDKVALRIAGAWTKRNGYVTNEITGNPIDGRDLWSTRVSLRFAPNDAIDANLIWEHFEEDDDRLRSGKQLCHRDARTEIQGFNVPGTNAGFGAYSLVFNQGCLPASMYAPESFEAPNGLSLPYFQPLRALNLPIQPHFDPYVSTTQSSDLRVIESTVDPHYRAESDVIELQVNVDISDGLTLTSETGYNVDDIFSTQDYNRFNTAPGAFLDEFPPGSLYSRDGVLDNGFFCDPQVGCANRLVAVDLSTGQASQFSQELRLASDFDGPFNFSLGANFLRYDTIDKYYVFINTLTMQSTLGTQGDAPRYPYVAGVTDNRDCLPYGMVEPDPFVAQHVRGCVYIDPNPIGALNDLGHNYFLSKNPYKLISYAVFGEAYYNITDNLKITGGLRWTVDKKEAPRIPSWVLAISTVGYPVMEVVEQEWREPTGRLTIDWKPDLGFTDETLLYGSLARGYKAGGANPPPAGVVGYADDEADNVLLDRSRIKPKTFDPEFVNAFEVGAKNTLLDGTVTLNLAAFYYDYKDYQISQIIDRSAVNYNFDARVWGIEIEADWRPLENLRLGFKGGYENTRIADGEEAIDIMDRTAGKEGWVLVRPFPTYSSNCVLPTYVVSRGTDTLQVDGNTFTGGNLGYCEFAYVLHNDPLTNEDYEADPPSNGSHSVYPGYPGFDPEDESVFKHNNGEGFAKPLGGNDLPNAPNFTATITADYTIPLPNDWLATLHTDLYWQSEAWTRVFNTPGYDKIKAYSNINVAAIFSNEEAGWRVMAYVKNVLDRDSITGAFLNSDDSGLTTNVFLTEPRLYGVRITKEWGGGPWWTGASADHTGPYPLTVEIGGQLQQQDAPYEDVAPGALAGLPPSANALATLQNRDLDWGDGRSLNITYRPQGGLWSVSAGVRYGRTNNDTSRGHAEVDVAYAVCGVPADLFGGILAPKYCLPTGSKYDPQLANYQTKNWSDATARDHEEHMVVDFLVGRDVALGTGLAKSKAGLGLRYSDFRSTTDVWAHGVADWEMADGWADFYNGGIGYTGRTADLTVERTFKGAGPMLSWEAAVRLLGGDDTGWLLADWSVTGGALFGKQKTSIEGEEMIAEYFGPAGRRPTPMVGAPVFLDQPEARSRSVTVPVVDLSVGLSYEIQRVKLSAGYRWERYFDVLDVGYDTAKDGDRTIDGPYFKFALGFGG